MAGDKQGFTFMQLKSQTFDELVPSRRDDINLRARAHKHAPSHYRYEPQLARARNILEGLVCLSVRLYIANTVTVE